MRPVQRTALGLVFAAAASAQQYGQQYDQQSALHPGGPGAGEIKTLGTVFFVVTGAIFLLVMSVVLLAILRRGRSAAQTPQSNRRLGAAVAIATGLTVVILFGFIIVSVSVGKVTSRPANPASTLTIEVTGNQWWWEIRYLNSDPSRIFVTANEIHIPTGRPVTIVGRSNDVIHSFWAPGLQGKRDLIPGHITEEWMQADQPGRFRGQCAEFCGLQHAHMAFWVVAEPEDQFQAWMNHQLQPAAEPSTATEAQGQQVFLNSACVLCHAIEGTPAAAQVGPDLTHFGSRLTLAAGALPNNKGNLAGWIADPQNIKPGTHMATVPLRPEDMQPLLEYLESLQ